MAEVIARSEVSAGQTSAVVRTENFVTDAALFIIEQARAALAERGEFRIALSGGNTPRPVYAEFGRIARELPWENVRFTFGDERCVPPDDPESNYRMARESLFGPQSIPEKSIISSNFRRISALVIPRIAPFRKIFSRPVSSG